MLWSLLGVAKYAKVYIWVYCLIWLKIDLIFLNILLQQASF